MDRPIHGPFTPRRFQAEALEAIARGRAGGRHRFWVSLPPGAGKTIVGTELIADIGHPAVVLCPNTAIQSQWVSTWGRYGRGAAGAERSLETDVTVLTYQSLATFDREDRDTSGSLVDQLHDNGRALVEALHEAGPVTIVLDECHHLLEVWGALLTEVLAEVPEATVLGLTATPPTVLDRRQAEQVQDLFGDIVYSASIPAAVREGDLAPFAELAWLVEPTDDEQHWLSDSAARFLDLTTDLLDPTYGSTPILTWCDQRFGGLIGTWQRFEQEEPELARAGLRLVHADLLALPEGARLREQHRQELTADDWATLIHDWVRGCLARTDLRQDDAVIEDLRQALPGIGYHLTRRGVSSVVSALDRVLSRSEAKMAVAAQVVAAKHRVLGDRLRAVVVCDHERAVPTSSSALRHAPALYGSAIQVMVALRETPVRSVLVTGRTVAAVHALAEQLVAHVAEHDPDLRLGLEPLPDLPELVTVSGWSSRQWVPHVTRFFEQGRAQVLVGTRALLGEGWDAKGVNALIDLSTAATTSAVVQTRGRALRTDPAWPDKVAITWSVVCVAEGHPGGDSDWKRFVRKHDGYFGVDDDGDVVSGVAHVDARFSPFAPPQVASFEAVNLDMADRTATREEIRDRWRVGEPYTDTIRHTIRVMPEADSPIADLLVESRPDAPEPPSPPLARMGPHGPVGTTAGWSPRRHPWVAARSCAVELGTTGYAWAVADAMADLGLGDGARAVDAHIGADGEYRLGLDGVDEATSLRFVEALEELLGPILDPSWLIAQELAPTPSNGTGWRVLVGSAKPAGRLWFCVPSSFARRKEQRAAFKRAWSRWVSATEPVPVGAPEGQAALAAWLGSSAADVAS